jgi:hypothetical protein
MDTYLVVSEVELGDCTTHFIHCISQSLQLANDVFESIDKKDKDGLLLIKMKSDKIYHLELFGISKYDDVQVIKGYPVWYTIRQ